MSSTSTEPGQAKPQAPKKRRMDWEAVERDYRTGRFTDQELADKYGNLVSRQAVTKMAKTKGWQKDLTEAVRQATKASLIAEQVRQRQQQQQQDQPKKVAPKLPATPDATSAATIVAEATAEAVDATATAVLAAAEANKQVILAHRNDILTLRSMLMGMAAELQQLGRADVSRLAEVLTSGAESDADAERLEALRDDLAAVSRLPSRILSVQRLTQAMTRLQLLERTAFGLDDPEQPPPVDELADLSDEELEARINERLTRR